uniref:HTH La-type RNA-binding domain-containing protein n=1 Tax=Crocodylus porosus TaxID=8502 RepID=A0A7M4F7T9_CROPO
WAENNRMQFNKEKLCQQVEYYFGMYNLERDKLLKELIKRGEGWVSCRNMVLKLSGFGYFSHDCSVPLDALRKSKSGFIEVRMELKLQGLQTLLEDVQMQETAQRTFQMSIFLILNRETLCKEKAMAQNKLQKRKKQL